LYYVCTDRQGSITALLNPNGTVAEKYSYDAYGRRRNPINWTDYNVPAPTLINRGYTGHEHLDGFGLINMNGRIYDPVIGRILSPDKVVQAPGYTQSYNRYSYCMNNPLRYTDPSGWSYYDGMKRLYNYEGGGFWYRGSYQQNTADGWVSWTQGFSGGNGGWSTGATPLHYSPAPGSEGYTFVGKNSNGEGSFIDNATGYKADANTALRNEVIGYFEGENAQNFVRGIIGTLNAIDQENRKAAQDRYDNGLLASVKGEIMLGGSHIKTGLYYGSRYNFFGFQNIGGGIGLYSKPFQWDINNNGLDLPLDNYFGAEASYLVVGAAFEFNVTQQWKLESWEFNLGPHSIWKLWFII
jgi:RHS repeat-associated protein